MRVCLTCHFCSLPDAAEAASDESISMLCSYVLVSLVEGDLAEQSRLESELQTPYVWVGRVLSCLRVFSGPAQ